MNVLSSGIVLFAMSVIAFTRLSIHSSWLPSWMSLTWPVVLVYPLMCALLYLLYSRYKYVQQYSHIPGLPVKFGLIGVSQIAQGNTRQHGKLAVGCKELLSSYPRLNLSSGEDRGVYSLWLSPRPSVLVTSPEGIKQVLNGKDTMKKGPVYDIIREFFGDGLATASSERWAKHRKLLTPAFHLKILESVTSIVSTQGKILVSMLDREASRKSDRSIHSIVEPIFAATLDVLFESSMGVKLESQLKPSSQINVTIRAIFEVLVHYVMTPWMWITPLFNMSPFGRTSWRHVTYYNGFCEKIVLSRMNEMKSKMIDDSNNNNGDDSVSEDTVLRTREKEPFMDTLLREHLKDPKGFTLSDVMDETNIFVAAGHDTTGWAVSYTLYLLGNHPHVQAKVHQEIDTLYSGTVVDGEELTPELLKHFKYTDAVFKEALRLYTPIPAITRVATEDVTVCDYHIPKGTELVLGLYLVHRDPVYWPQPDKFIPERFLEQSLPHQYAYVPFAAGPRNCIGQKYALLQSKSFLIQILRHFTLESVTPGEDIPTYIAPVAVAFNPIHIKFHKRVIGSI